MAKQLLTTAPGSQPRLRHGTRYAYRVKKCKCQECRAWNAAFMADYRARRTERDGPNWRPSGWPSYNRRHKGAYE